MTQGWVALWLAMAVFASGCNSTMRGQKLTREGARQDGGKNLRGIPFQMPRPRFTISENTSANSSSATAYTVNLDYEPDPLQRYSINIDPAILTKIGFQLTYGEFGQIVSTTSSTTEELTPTITAVGQFLVSALESGAKIAAAFDSSVVSEQDPYQQVKWSVETCVEITTIWPTGQNANSPGTATNAEIAVGNALVTRLAKIKTCAAFLNNFHYRTEVERRWLRAARYRLEEAVTTRMGTRVNAAAQAYDRPLGTGETAMLALAANVQTRTGARAQGALWSRVREHAERLLTKKEDVILFATKLDMLADALKAPAYVAAKSNAGVSVGLVAKVDAAADAKSVLRVWDDHVRTKTPSGTSDALVTAMRDAILSFSGGVSREPAVELIGASARFSTALLAENPTRNPVDSGMGAFVRSIKTAKDLKEKASVWAALFEGHESRLLVDAKSMDLFRTYLDLLDDPANAPAFEKSRQAAKAAGGADHRLVAPLTAAKTKAAVVKLWDEVAAKLNMPDAETTLLAALVRAFANHAKTVEAANMIEAILTMPWKTWDYRHVLYLESEINEKTKAALMKPTPALVTKISELRKQRADALEISNEYARALELRKFIKKPRYKSETVGINTKKTEPAMDAYGLARAELDSLETKMLSARVSLKPAAPVQKKASTGGTAPKPKRLPAVFPWLNPEPGRSVDSKWIEEQLAARALGSPHFVIVLEKKTLPVNNQDAEKDAK